MSYYNQPPQFDDHWLTEDIARELLKPKQVNNKQVNKSKVMIKTKVKAVQGNGTWDSPNGTLYKFEYTMEDGTILTAQHKTQDGNFNEGDEVEYQVKGENAYGKWGKVSKPQDQPFNGGGGFNKGTNNAILYQVCLKGVMDYKIQHGHQYFTAEEINNLALDIARKAKENIEKL